MTKPILASGLLKTASRLAGHGAGAGRPALADLRRATSTAYYALFHQVVRHGAFDSLPDGDESQAAEIARWFTHTGILAAANLVVEASSSRPLTQVKRPDRSGVMSIGAAAQGPVPRQLLILADAFVSLQDARHRADYDGNYDPVRAVTINHVKDAESAVSQAWSLWSAQWSPKPARLQAHAAYACFLRLALLKSGGPKSR